MAARHLAKLDASLAIRVNNISSDIRFTLFTMGVYSILSTRCNSIFPNARHAASVLIITNNLDAIFMRFFNEILYEERFVVEDLDSNIIQTHLILYDLPSC